MRGSRFLAEEPIDKLYAWFADETAATSPAWEALCRWIARTPSINARLDALPGQARQPNRLLATVRFLNGPTQPGTQFEAWLGDNWTQIEHTILTRTTQTNEPGRCAVVAPVLASLPQPIALLELGASAGLCLLPDRYRYRYDDGRTPASGPSPESTGGDEPEPDDKPAQEEIPVSPCRVTGTPPGDVGLLRVAARRGLDLNPLNPTDPDTQRWLRALIWPGEEDREERLAAALRLATMDPPIVTQADLTANPAEAIAEALAALRAEAPEATPVILHSAFLAYLPRDARQAVVDAIRGTGARWVSMEGPQVVPGIDAAPLGPAPEGATFVVSLDGEPMGWSQAHGRSVRWVG